MSWIFIADDGEQVHYDVPPRVVELEQQCDDSDRELQDALNKLAALREAAKAIDEHKRTPTDKCDAVGCWVVPKPFIAALLQEQSDE